MADHPLTAVDVGWEVWSTERGSAGVDDGGQQIEPLGGIVLARRYDPDEDRFDYLTLHPNGGRQLVVRWLTGHEVNPDAIAEPILYNVGKTVRRLADSLTVKRGSLTDDEIQRVAWMHQLSGTLARLRTPRTPGAPPRLEHDLGPPAPAGWYVD